jgi:hypothetical protein
MITSSKALIDELSSSDSDDDSNDDGLVVSENLRNSGPIIFENAFFTRMENIEQDFIYIIIYSI